MVHVYECGLTRSSSKGRVYCYHQFMHYCMSIVCLRCTHKLFSNSQRQHVGIIVFFLTKNMQLCVVLFHFLSDEQQRYCIGHDEHLDEAHRSTEAFSDLSSSCFGSKPATVDHGFVHGEPIVFLAPRDLRRSTTTRTNTHHPFEASPVLNGAIA